MSGKIIYIEGDAITNGARWCNAYGAPRLAKDMLEQLTAIQARIEKLETGLRRIVNGEYDNARTIGAAEKFARELLRDDK
jgi:hypothetical protein